MEDCRYIFQYRSDSDSDKDISDSKNDTHKNIVSPSNLDKYIYNLNNLNTLIAKNVESLISNALKLLREDIILEHVNWIKIISIKKATAENIECTKEVTNINCDNIEGNGTTSIRIDISNPMHDEIVSNSLDNLTSNTGNGNEDHITIKYEREKTNNNSEPEKSFEGTVSKSSKKRKRRQRRYTMCLSRKKTLNKSNKHIVNENDPEVSENKKIMKVIDDVTHTDLRQIHNGKDISLESNITTDCCNKTNVENHVNMNLHDVTNIISNSNESLNNEGSNKNYTTKVKLSNGQKKNIDMKNIVNNSIKDLEIVNSKNIFASKSGPWEINACENKFILYQKENLENLTMANKENYAHEKYNKIIIKNGSICRTMENHIDKKNAHVKVNSKDSLNQKNKDDDIHIDQINGDTSANLKDCSTGNKTSRKKRKRKSVYTKMSNTRKSINKKTVILNEKCDTNATEVVNNKVKKNISKAHLNREGDVMNEDKENYIDVTEKEIIFNPDTTNALSKPPILKESFEIAISKPAKKPKRRSRRYTMFLNPKKKIVSLKEPEVSKNTKLMKKEVCDNVPIISTTNTDPCSNTNVGHNVDVNLKDVKDVNCEDKCKLNNEKQCEMDTNTLVANFVDYVPTELKEYFGGTVSKSAKQRKRRPRRYTMFLNPKKYIVSLKEPEISENTKLMQKEVCDNVPIISTTHTDPCGNTNVGHNVDVNLKDVTDVNCEDKNKLNNEKHVEMDTNTLAANFVEYVPTELKESFNGSNTIKTAKKRKRRPRRYTMFMTCNKPGTSKNIADEPEIYGITKLVDNDVTDINRINLENNSPTKLKCSSDGNIILRSAHKRQKISCFLPFEGNNATNITEGTVKEPNRLHRRKLFSLEKYMDSLITNPEKSGFLNLD